MLTYLSVKNLAIVSELVLNFDSGMHVITGETGAGKSIIIDALSIALGERASSDQIRAQQRQAEVTVTFDLQNLPLVIELLRDQDLAVEHECIIRRIINTDGPSRAYINGHPVTAQQIKSIAPHLVHIHSQHQHHALLESDYQRQILDSYAQHDHLLLKVKESYNAWFDVTQQIKLLNESQQQLDRLSLLEYQIQEFKNLNLQSNELQTLEQRHKQLAKSEELLATCQNVTAILDNDDTGILKQLHTAANQIAHLQKITPRFNNTVELLQQAIIQVTETNSDLHSFLEQADLDPQELYNLEQRLSAIHALARKLKVNPELLNEHFQTLCSQYELLVNANTKLLEMEQKLQLCLQEYQQAALKLHESRMIAAKRLAKEIIAHLKNLELTHAKFEVLSDFNPQQQPSMNGLDQISFMVSANPGQPLGPLKKIASGGELSRISLAIQAISAQRMATPTLILDEVDVGISGKTAAAVGHMMRELAKQAQILCITHLPQVAALGSVHFKVTKTQTKDSTSTAIIPLNRQARVQELARLLGGISITPEALAHAESMLAVATP